MPYDVGIVGAGIRGASVAFQLAQRGVSTIVFERGTPGGDAPPLTTAVSSAQYENAFVARVARDSITMYENFADLTEGGDADHHRTGAMSLLPVNEVIELHRWSARLNALGIGIDILEGDQLADALPGFVLDDVAAAAWEPEAGHVDQAGTIVGLVRYAVRHGVHLRTHVTVERVREYPRHVTVHTSEGDAVDVGRLLVAAGPWTRPLVRDVGADVPIRAERHVAAAFSWGSATPIPFVFIDVLGGYYFKPYGVGGFHVGPRDDGEVVNPDDYVDNVPDEEAGQLAAPVVLRVPALAGAMSYGGWSSIYDMSPDWEPVIGQVSGRVFVDAGMNGHGFRIGPALGAHVADLLTGEDVDAGLSTLSPYRFGDTERAYASGGIRLLG